MNDMTGFAYRNGTLTGGVEKKVERDAIEDR